MNLMKGRELPLKERKREISLKERILKERDRDLMEDSKRIDFSFMMNLMKGRELPLKERKREIPLKERDQDLMEDFKQTDVDNNGFISFEELHQASSEVVTPEQWRLMCEYIGAEAHIGITFKQFKQVHSMGCVS